MHGAAYQYVVDHRPSDPGDVLDVGGRNINGSVRGVLHTEGHAYTVVDLVDGADVDVVGDICELGLVDVADTVVCLEVLEHTEAWPDVVAACVAACRPGGTVIFTAAGPTRAAHSAFDGGELRDGEHYENIAVDALDGVLAGLDVAGYEIDVIGDDIRAVLQLPKQTKPKAARKRPVRRQPKDSED